MNKLILIPILTILPLSGLIVYLEFNSNDDTQIESQYTKLQANYEKLKSDYDEIKIKNNDLLEALDTDKTTISLLNEQLQHITQEQQREFEQEIQDIKLKHLFESIRDERKPLTTIINQKVHWRVSDSKGNVYNWEMPMETYDGLVRYQPLQKIRFSNPGIGQEYESVDFSPYVRKSFTGVIDQVYDNSKNDYDFGYEVWYIVSQLTTYSDDIGEDPRWALETLTRGGGDCEDTAILIADMLRSSAHTKNWKIRLYYFDAHNPKNPQTINHVAIHVDDGRYSYILESTEKSYPYVWTDGIKGWHVDV